MKKIEAYIRPEKFGDVKVALEKIGYPGMSFHKIEGHGRQKGRIQVYRGTQYRLEFVEKTKLEIVVPDADAEKVVTAILEAACTKQTGDGKIFVTDLKEAIRIRTGERGEAAL